MILILKTCVVLYNSVASNSSLGRCPNPALVIQLASIHYHIRLVRHAVNTNLTKAYFITLYLRPTAFADLDPRTLNIIYFYSKHQLTSTFTLNKHTNNSTIGYCTVLDNNLIIWFSTRPNSSSTEINEATF